MSQSNKVKISKLENEKHSSPYAVFTVCMVYGSLSFLASFLNKKLLHRYETLSPVNSMMCQCFFGVVMSLVLIAMKDSNKFSLEKLYTLGIEIPSSDVIYKHRILGFKAGLVGLVPVFFAVFALKYTSIPLYLAFRRCGLLSSVIVMFFWQGERPSRTCFRCLIHPFGIFRPYLQCPMYNFQFI